MRSFLIYASVLTVAFCWVLWPLLKLSLHSELHNHLLLIPFITFYLWRFIDPKTPLTGQARASGKSIGVVGAVGMAFVGLHLWLRQKGLPVTEHLWAGVIGYLLFLLSGATTYFGWKPLKDHAFALGFLVFFIPLPLAVTDAMSRALQSGSAEVTEWGLRLAQVPAVRDGLAFQMPGLEIQVAEECSGVRSTLVLFITSLLAGKMFLRSGWKRGVLALATIPLGLLRNALRITVLSWLTVNVDRGVIDGPLHHQGGPVFFALSLGPLFVLMWLLKRSEARAEKEGGTKGGTAV